MSRGARRRIAKGVYVDAYGQAATVKAAGVQREKRFPFDADLDTIKLWQQQTRGALLTAVGTAVARRRTPDPFRAAVTRYLAQIAGRPGAAADASHLAAWVERLGDRSRASITAEDVRLAFAAWRQAGQRRPHQAMVRQVAPQTLRHRYRVLKKLWRVLDGPHAPTPCDDVERPGVPRTVPRDVDIETIRAVLARLKTVDVKAHARLLVLASTAKRPAELMRATPGDLDLRRRIWRIRPAKGGEPQQLHLNREMAAAWRTLVAADAWGPYDTTAYARRLRACGWPRDVRPYNVRHALAIELLRRGADLGDIQAHLGHASLDTTRQFYAGVLTERMKRTSRRLEGRLPAAIAASRSASLTSAGTDEMRTKTRRRAKGAKARKSRE